MKLERARLVLLIASALLTTSLGATFGETRSGMQLEPSDAAADAPSRPAEGASSSGPGTPETDSVASLEDDADAQARAEDEAIEGLILARLSTRHTALPARERRALARTIVREARAHDLEPDLVLAVIEVESAGYHLAVSHVGAMGLMQLLPATAEELAEKLEITWHGDDTLFDPTTNVRLGTAYLRQLADRYGDVSIALAAYNWGPGRIDRRLRRGATVPSRYIEQVMRAYDQSGRIESRRS